MVLFRHLRDLFHVARDLGAGQALLAYRGRDVVYAVVGLLDRIARSGQHLGDTLDLLLCRLQGMQTSLYGGLNLVGFLAQGTGDMIDLVGRFCGFFRQLAHFVGHHRKAASLFAGTRRLNGRIQCQQIGLVGDVFDLLRHPGNGTCTIDEFFD